MGNLGVESFAICYIRYLTDAAIQTAIEAAQCSFGRSAGGAAGQSAVDSNRMVGDRRVDSLNAEVKFSALSLHRGI